MKLTFNLFAAALLIAVSGTAVTAHSFTKGDIKVTHPWTKATPGGAKVGAGYLKITNTGKNADTLVGGVFPGAQSVEIHEMKMDDGIMRMRQLENGLEVPAGGTVELKPGANHLMLMGLDKAIVQGDDIKGTLTFKNAGDIDVEFRVEAIGAIKSEDKKSGDAKPADAGHEHHH